MSEPQSLSYDRSTNQRRAKQVQSGAARAAILGISDGLVTNTSLILGVAGAGVAASFVRVAGIASLVAGAFSMAVGEYISMKAQAELLNNVLEMERETIRNHPEDAQKTLQEILTEQGVAEDHAQIASRDLSADPEKATTVYALNRLGINPNELGSPYAAAFSSLGTFAAGAFIPLAPWFFGKNIYVIITSLSLSGLSAIILGSYLGIQSGGKWYRVALRQLVLITIATGFTYFIGYLTHTTV